MESDSDDSGDELKQFEVDCESVEYISERERGTAARQADTFDGQLPPREWVFQPLFVFFWYL